MADVLKSVDERLAGSAPAEARLEELERSRVLWEADVEALLLKADSTLRSANNAEARARTMVRHVDDFIDPFDGDREEVAEAVRPSDVAPSEEEALQPLHLGVAEDDRTRALIAKFST